jgi:hypothetical protein
VVADVTTSFVDVEVVGTNVEFVVYVFEGELDNENDLVDANSVDSEDGVVDADIDRVVDADIVTVAIVLVKASVVLDDTDGLIVEEIVEVIRFVFDTT